MNEKDEICIVHMTYKILGGAELLSLSLYKALKDENYDVKIITSFIEPETIEKIFNIRINRKDIILQSNKVSYRLPKTIKHLIKIKSFYDTAKKNFKYSVLIDTYSNLSTNYDINYIHFPFIYKLVQERTYPFLYGTILKYLLKKWFNPSSKSIYLTNSYWTARKVYKYMNTIPIVLHPPILNSLNNNNIDSKEKTIITVSRISPEKRLIDILKLAGKLKNYEFIIVGTLSDKQYYDLLNKYIKTNRINNVKIFVNLPRDELFQLLKKAKIYLHPQYAEHFGLAIAESLSYRCIPLVYYDSGSCTDIVSKLDHRLCYNSINDVIEKINYIEVNYEKIQTKIEKIINEFMFDKFKKKVTKLINYLIKLKQG